MVREAEFAGRFYPARPKELKKTIKEVFQHKLGPGKAPTGVAGKNHTILGVMTPHAGYPYSGPIAAHAYHTLFKDGIPETFLLLGPNHSGMGHPISVYPEGKWRTPLGEVKIDEELASLLIESDTLQEGKKAHSGEHSLEVQLPFLQFTFPQRDFKIVPITCMKQDKTVIKKVAGKVIETITNSGKDVTIIASTDLSHYVPYEKAKKDDREALRAIEELKIEQLYNMVQEGYSMCGYGPVAVLMHCAKHFSALGGTLKYATSGDVIGDKAQVVGYASLAFTQVEVQEKGEKEKVKEKPVPA